METIVISIGGSILVPDESDTEYVKQLSKLLAELSRQYKLYVVVGGGRIARYYIKIARDLGADESYLDDIGIEVTRLNSRLLITALGDIAYPTPAINFNEAAVAGKSYHIVVMGGTHSGHTTDAVSAMLGERVKADRLVNATSVDGVYTADPKKDPGATKIDRMGYKELLDITLKGADGAGPNIVFDPLASKIIMRSGIPTFVVHGRDLDSLKKAISGDEEISGTIIK